MKVIGKKNTGVKSKKAFGKDRTENEDHGRGDKEIVYVSMTDAVNEISVNNSTTGNTRVISGREYYQDGVFMKIEQTGDPEIWLRDLVLWYATPLQGLLCMFSFYISYSPLSVTFHADVSVEDVTII